jgi:hypothetical protein
VRYKENLKYIDGVVYSYGTKVAERKDNFLVRLGYWSSTTSRHINYIAKEYNLIVR